MKTQVLHLIKNTVHLIYNTFMGNTIEREKYPHYVPLPIKVEVYRYDNRKKNHMG